MLEYIIHLKINPVYTCARLFNFHEENISRKKDTDSGKFLGSWNLWEPV